DGHAQLDQILKQAHRLNRPNCAATAFFGLGSPSWAIVQRDDGRFQLGIDDDAPGPFESQSLAAAVALQRTNALLRTEAA
ncbi:hypothetical protein, partial [Bradyrhizobium elkanii]